MTNPASQPPPQPRPREPLGAGAVLFLTIGGVILAVMILGSIIKAVSGDEEPTSEERLCTLLDGGWTTSQLIANNVWVDWPEQQSPLSRSIEVAKAAERGGCFELA